MPPLPADSIHARACKLKCEKILTRPEASLTGKIGGSHCSQGIAKTKEAIKGQDEHFAPLTAPFVFAVW